MKPITLLFLFFLTATFCCTAADDYDYEYTDLEAEDTDLSRTTRDNERFIQDFHEYLQARSENSAPPRRRRKKKLRNNNNNFNNPNNNNNFNNPNNNNKNFNNPNSNNNNFNNPNNNNNNFNHPKNNNQNDQATSFQTYHNVKNVKNHQGMFNQKDIDDVFLKGNHDYGKMFKNYNRPNPPKQPPNVGGGDKDRFNRFTDTSTNFNNNPIFRNEPKKKHKNENAREEISRPPNKPKPFVQRKYQPVAASSENVAVVVNPPKQNNHNDQQSNQNVDDGPPRMYGEKLNGRRKKKPNSPDFEILEMPPEAPQHTFQSYDQMDDDPYVVSASSQYPVISMESTPYSVDIYDANPEIMKLFPSNANAFEKYQPAAPLTTSSSRGHHWDSNSFQNSYESYISTPKPTVQVTSTSAPVRKFEWDKDRFKLSYSNNFETPTSTSNSYQVYESTKGPSSSFDWTNDRFKISNTNNFNTQTSTQSPVKYYSWNSDAFKLTDFDTRVSTSNPFEVSSSPYQKYESTTSHYNNYETTAKPIKSFGSLTNIFDNKDNQKDSYKSAEGLAIKHSDQASSNTFISNPYLTAKPSTYGYNPQEYNSFTTAQNEAFKNYQSSDLNTFKTQNSQSSGLDTFNTFESNKSAEDLKSEIKNSDPKINITPVEYRSSTAPFFSESHAFFSTADPLKAYEYTLSKKYPPKYELNTKSPFDFDTKHRFNLDSGLIETSNHYGNYNFDQKAHSEYDTKTQYNFNSKPQLSFNSKPELSFDSKQHFNFDSKNPFDIDIKTFGGTFDDFGIQSTTPMYSFGTPFVSEFDMKGNPLSSVSTFSPIEGKDTFSSNYDKKMELDLTKAFYSMNKFPNSPYTTSFTLDDVRTYAPNFQNGFSFGKDYSTLNFSPYYQNPQFGVANFNKQNLQGVFKDLNNAHASGDMSQPILIPVPQPYPVKVPVAKPVPVPVVKEIKIPIEKEVPYPVVKTVPYPIEKPVPVPVEKQVPIPVPKPYPVKVPIIKNIYHHAKASTMEDVHGGDEEFDYEEVSERPSIFAHTKPTPAIKRKPARSQRPVSTSSSTMYVSSVRWPARKNRDPFHESSSEQVSSWDTRGRHHHHHHTYHDDFDHHDRNNGEQERQKPRIGNGRRKRLPFKRSSAKPRPKRLLRHV